MRLERNRYRLALLLSRAADDVGQHAGMGPMHAVKVPHAQERWTEAGGNVIEFVKNLHCSFGAGPRPQRVILKSHGQMRMSQGLVQYPLPNPRARASAPHQLNLKLQLHPIV